MSKVIFVIIVLTWCLIGFIGVMRCKEYRTNWEMIIFMCFIPFLAVIAHFCGL